MERRTIEVFKRQGSGSSESRRVRNTGLIPSVVYSRGEKSISVAVNYNAFVKVAQNSRSSHLFSLKSELPELNGKTVLVRDIQKNYLKGTVAHIDFQLVRDTDVVTLAVPLKAVGLPYGVKQQGGILQVPCREISLSCLPADIPESLEVSVEELAIGKSIKAGEVKLPPRVTLAGNPTETIASVVGRMEEVETTTAAAAPAEGEAAAAAAPAEGAAAAPAEGEKAEKGKK